MRRSRGAALDDELQRVAHAVGGDRQPGDEFARMAVLEEHQVLIEQAVEHASLRGGDDAIADARQRQHRAESGGAAQHEQRRRPRTPSVRISPNFSAETMPLSTGLSIAATAVLESAIRASSTRAQRVARTWSRPKSREQPSEQPESADVFVRCATGRASRVANPAGAKGKGEFALPTRSASRGLNCRDRDGRIRGRRISAAPRPAGESCAAACIRPRPRGCARSPASNGRARDGPVWRPAP